VTNLEAQYRYAGFLENVRDDIMTFVHN
jgi:hypothetical protein